MHKERWDVLCIQGVPGSPGRVQALPAPGESAAPSAADGPERQDWEFNVHFRAQMPTADRAVNHTNIGLELSVQQLP